MEQIESAVSFSNEKQQFMLHLTDILLEEGQISETEKNRLKILIQKMQPKKQV